MRRSLVRRHPVTDIYQVQAEGPTPEQRAFIEAAAKRQTARRTRRQRQLTDARGSVEAAIAAYGEVSRRHVLEEGLGNDVVDIGLRAAFIYLEHARPGYREGSLREEELEPIDVGPPEERLRRDWSTRPPLTRLVGRRHRGLSLYLAAIFTAHLEHRPDTQVLNPFANATRSRGRPSWATLAGLGGGPNTRARRLRVARALNALSVARLVDLPRGRQMKYEGFQLLRDDGTERPYLVPGSTTKGARRLPAAFFLNGWHLVLTPSEVAVLFAVIDAANRLGPNPDPRNPGVALPQRVRWERYGLSGEVYTAANELAEFGLLRRYDLMEDRWAGRFGRRAADEDDPSWDPVPYRFACRLEVMNEPALDVVGAALKAHPTPPRFAPRPIPRVYASGRCGTPTS
jgi:hypothetical protein